jgi:hypothetical protein
VTFVEDQSVKGAVDQVTGSPGQYQRKAGNQSKRHVLLPEFGEVPNQGAYGRHPEDAKEIFANTVAKFHSEGHPVVFDKMDDEPVFGDDDLFAQHKMGFDKDLQYLVDQQYQKNDEYGFCFIAHDVFQTKGQTIPVQLFTANRKSRSID